MIAEFNRQRGSKTKAANRQLFESPGWEHFVESHIGSWRAMALYWLKTFQKPLHILVYEQLVQNQCIELIAVADFLQMKVSPQTMKCLMSHQKTGYKRIKPSWLNRETLFSTYLRTVVNKNIYELLAEVEKGPLYDSIESYLHEEND
ncbi:hypothetical protein ACF0H5_007536 [Mactra antiquata]